MLVQLIELYCRYFVYRFFW